VAVGCMLIGPRLINAAYNVLCTLISWPFM
jgi:hypothetical protein